MATSYPRSSRVSGSSPVSGTSKDASRYIEVCFFIKKLFRQKSPQRNAAGRTVKKVIFAIGIILSLNDATEGMRQRSATWSTGTHLQNCPLLSGVALPQSDEFPEHTANYQGEDDPNELIQKIHRVASKIEKTQCMRDLEPLIDLIQDLRTPLYKFEKGIRRINRHDPDTRDYILFPVMDKLLRQEFVQSLAYTDTSSRKVRKRAFSVSEKELLHLDVSSFPPAQ